MSITNHRAKQQVEELRKSERISDLARGIKTRHAEDLDNTEPIPADDLYSQSGQEKRLEFVRNKLGVQPEYLSGNRHFDRHESLEGNIENFIGMTQVPTGLVGPLLVNGTAARGDFFLPLATTEGALVASYNRGAKATRLSGGITSVCLIEGVQRSPLFKFENIMQVGRFIFWVLEQEEQFREITGKVSNYAKLVDMKTTIEGNVVILTFEFTTGDAAGQNMVTICSNAICEYIIGNSPIKPVCWFVESNYSGDKKATALSFSHVRGKKVTSEVTLPRDIVTGVLKSTPEAMAEYWRSSTLAVIQSGSIGAQGHVANGLTALFMACGQDVACIAEAATGITRMEVNGSGELYCAVTLPNLIVGTVGGGTGLPTQRECLAMIGCTGKGTARKFAEICGSLAVTGELSIAAALSAGHFTQAHQQLGRKTPNDTGK